ncbi:MAG TPA: hypothetical protein VFC92_09525, partial [Bacteroidales bacterium]|nr:hypothetical protein [Bacteroidales bacterium]
MQNLLQFSSKIAATFVLLAIMTMPALALAQTYENFDNLPQGSTPGDDSYIGNNGNPWYYKNCRGDVPIDGKAITLVGGATNSYIYCYEMSGNLQTLSFDYMQVGSDPVQVLVFVGGIYFTSITTSQQGVIQNSGSISIGGDLGVELEFLTNSGSNEVALDNINWTVTLTPDNIETFDNLVADDYFGSFIGENDHKWEYYYISMGALDGPAITLDEGSGWLKCEDINQGMYSLSFDYVQSGWDPVYLEIRINGEIFETISSDEKDVIKNTGELIVDQANGVGGFPLSIEISVAYDEDNGQDGGEVTIDNIAWTNRPRSYTVFTGTGNWSDLSKWSGGIPDKNSDAFIEGNATLDIAATAHYVGLEPQGNLTIQGKTLTAETFTIRADATGSGSFIGSASDLNISYAFMNWHIKSGVAEAWHLLSSPVPNQSLINPYNNNQFTPSGTYPDGSGYDFYAWDEPSEMWLNRKVSGNHINSFVPGKGYLVAYQDISKDKTFGSYTFNSGAITVPITAPGMPSKSTNGEHAGANLIGNPYPSSIDWKNRADLDKNNLKYEDNGYTMYIWNDAVKNYGAYIDNASGDAGTNGVGRYIPPLQGFFVIAQSEVGNFVFNDGARVHSNQLYMKSGNEEGFRLSVQAPENAGKDEILLDFGHEANQGGADKWYSMSANAPSLYLPSAEKDYSIRFLSSVDDNPLIPLSFKAGLDGEYSIKANFNTAAFTSVKLKDLQTGKIHDLIANPDYTFSATTGDDAKRFTLVFGAVGIDTPEAERDVQVYANGSILYLNSSSATPAEIKVYNLT